MVTLAHQDFPYHDYHTDTTTGVYQNYTVGENNLDGDGTQNKRFIERSGQGSCNETGVAAQRRQLASSVG